MNDLADIAAGEVRSEAGECEDLQVEDDRPLLVRYKAGSSPSEFPVPAAWSRTLVDYSVTSVKTLDGPQFKSILFLSRHSITVFRLSSYSNPMTLFVNIFFFVNFLSTFLFIYTMYYVLVLPLFVSVSFLYTSLVSINHHFCTGKIHRRFGIF